MASKLNLPSFESVEFTPDQELALKWALGGISFFYSGCAGTGKSLVMIAIVDALRRKHRRIDSVAVTSSTGVSALNISGETLHRFSGIGHGTNSLSSIIRDIEASHIRRKAIVTSKVLFIDEISMISADTLELVEKVLRLVRGKFEGQGNGDCLKDEPFGGLQVIATGDFLQLPPVRSSRLACQSDVWKRTFKTSMMFTKVFRQGSDTEFMDMLSRVRNGHLSLADEKRLRATQFRAPKEIKPHIPFIKATELHPHKKTVDVVNKRELHRLITPKNPKMVFPAVYHGKEETIRGQCIAPDVLEVCVGAQVMCVKNIDQEKGVVNGAQGVVKRINPWKQSLQYRNLSAMSREFKKKTKATNLKRQLEEPDMGHEIVVLFDNGTEHHFHQYHGLWKNYVGTFVIASMEQFPLTLAWAVTIHKSQGLTLRHVKMNLTGCFAPGQAYVALSRATSLENAIVVGCTGQVVMANTIARTFYEILAREQAASLHIKHAEEALSRIKDKERKLKAAVIAHANRKRSNRVLGIKPGEKPAGENPFAIAQRTKRSRLRK